MKKSELEQITINVRNDEIFIAPYGEFCLEQAELTGMRYLTEKIEEKEEWEASGVDINNSFEKFKEYFNSLEEAELHCQEHASKYLNLKQDYISASYNTANEAASDIINYTDIYSITEGNLDKNCSVEELTNYIQELIK